MNPLKHALEALHLHHDDDSSSDTSPSDDEATKIKKRARAQQARLEKEERVEERKEAEKEDREARRKHWEEVREADPLKEHYGIFPLVLPKTTAKVDKEDLFTLPNQHKTGDLVIFQARIHHNRPQGPDLLFIVLRQRLHTLQGVLHKEDGLVSETMVRWAEHLPNETVVLVHGILQEPLAPEHRVKSATIHELEIKITKLHVVAEVEHSLPFHVDFRLPDAKKDAEPVSRELHVQTVDMHTRFDNRLLDLRSNTAQAAMRLQSAVVRTFRTYLDERNFIEIHSPKLQGGATESGSAVFGVNYFGRPAFLAQSPQLSKQMAIAADMRRVYEIGPVFRAEKSQTHRHLTEFVGLDLEMEIDHLDDVIDMLDGVLKHIFATLLKDFRLEIEQVKTQFPHDDIVFPEKTVRLLFPEGIKLLKDSGWKNEDGTEIDEFEDLSTPAEKRLGALVKEKYGTDYYILNKFPLSARPFYTMPDPEDPRYSNSCDFFLRGEEILSGGQRIHRASLLEERMKSVGMNPNTLEEYVNGFRWGCPPHGGGGIGLERVLMLFLKMGNIRYASFSPRDPRSFPKNVQEEGHGHHANPLNPAAHSIRGPEATTLSLNHRKPSRRVARSKSRSRHGHGGTEEDAKDKEVKVPESVNPEPPSLENLIATYGDSSNTSWTDPTWSVWRHAATGAAVGYARRGGFAIIWGRPLCDDTQIAQVAEAFIDDCENGRLEAVDILADEHDPANMVPGVSTDSSTSALATAVTTTDQTSLPISGVSTPLSPVETPSRASSFPTATTHGHSKRKSLGFSHHGTSSKHYAPRKLKPIWACVDKPTMEVLTAWNWRGLVVAQEERVDPATVKEHEMDKRTRQKIQRAERAGVQVVHVEGEFDDELKAEVEVKMKEWQAHRKGSQIYTAGLRPWNDPIHRKYFYAKDKEGNVCSLLVLAQLKECYGFQIKYALDFPSAPSGAIEMIISHAMKYLADNGIGSVTFGVAGSDELKSAGNVSGVRMKLLAKSYNTLHNQFHLGSKSGFREKWGAMPDDLYLCYPKHGLGLSGIDAMMKVLTKDKN